MSNRDIRYSAIANSYVVENEYFWWFPFGRRFALWRAKRYIKKLSQISKDVDELKRQP